MWVSLHFVGENLHLCGSAMDFLRVVGCTFGKAMNPTSVAAPLPKMRYPQVSIT